MKLAIALLLCGAAVVAGDTSNAPDSSPEKTGPKPGEILAKVSGKLRLARKDYRRLTKFERIAVKDARQEVFGQSAEGKAAAASLRTAAGLLETAAGREGVAEKKASQYRAIASALDAMGRSVSGAKPATQKTPEADLRKAAAALTKTWGDVMSKPRSDELQKSWTLLAEGDPRQRVLAAGIGAANALAADCTGCKDTAVQTAQTLVASVADRFQKVPTVRRKKVNLDTAPP